MNDAFRAPVVLIVEDEWFIREEMSQAFQQAGWSVIEMSTGEGCLAVARNGCQFDAIVTDIRLSGCLNGWDVAEALRLISPELPVVYASANSLEKARMVCGGVFLSKPCRTAELVETCRTLCGLADSCGSPTLGPAIGKTMEGHDG